MPRSGGAARANNLYTQVFAAEAPFKLTKQVPNRTASEDAFLASFLQRNAPVIHFALTAYSGQHASEPSAVLITRLLQSERVDDAVRIRAKETAEKETKVRRRARTMAQKMSADMRLWAVKCLGYGLGCIWRWLFKDEVFVDQEGLERISALAPGSPIVYLPTHRSHVDYLLLSYVLFSRNVTVPHIAAGDNLQIPFLGWVMRKGGAFFMRRSIRGSPDENVYKVVLAEYIQLLLQKGQSIEFFIEGGRGREGKVCVPKLGLLSLVLDSVLDGHLPDAFLVPLAIDYEVVLDEASYIRESLGLKKPRETLMQALRAFWSALRRDNGRVFVTFSEPLSLREWLQQKQGGGAREKRLSLVGSETRQRLQDKLAAFNAASAEAASPKRTPDPSPETSVKARAAQFLNGGEVAEALQSPSSTPQKENGSSLERRPSAVGALAAKFNAVGDEKPLLPSTKHATPPHKGKPPLSPNKLAAQTPKVEAENGGLESTEHSERVEEPTPKSSAATELLAERVAGNGHEEENRSSHSKTGSAHEAESNTIGEASLDEPTASTDNGETKKVPFNAQEKGHVSLEAKKEGQQEAPSELSVAFREAEEFSSPVSSGQPMIDHVFVSKGQRRDLVGALGEDLGIAIRSSVAITSTALLSAALLTAKDGSGLDREDCISAVDYIARQVLARGGQIAVANGAPWSRETARVAVGDGERLLGTCLENDANRIWPRSDAYQRLTLQFHCNQLVHLFAGEALVACAFAAALSEKSESEASRRRSIIPRSKLADNARWLRRFMRPEFDPLIGAAETDPTWEEQFASYLERLVQAEAVLSLEGGRQLRPASLDPDGKNLEARGVLSFAAALVRPHIRTYAYALRCLLALQNRPPLPDAAIVAALQAACEDPLLPPIDEQASHPSTIAPSEYILPSVFILRGLLTTVHSLGLLRVVASPRSPGPLKKTRDFCRVESVADFAPLSQQPEASLPEHAGLEGPGLHQDNAPPEEQLQSLAAKLDGFAAPLRI